jgi:hypothetical protein
MKRKSLVLGLMLMPLLASCGGTAQSTSEKDTYKVTTAFSENASFDFGSKFDDNRFVITNQKDEEIAKVNSSMVTGFDTTKTTIGKDITATVTYQGQSLPFTYEISSYYSLENFGSVNLLDGGSVSINSVNGYSKLTSYTIPDVVEGLPAPASSWPVTEFEATAGDALASLTLGKNLTRLSTGSVSYNTVVKPASNGVIQYENGFLVDTSSKTLFGLASTLTGEVTLPSTATRIAPSAFAMENTTITKIIYPASYTTYTGYNMGAYHLKGVTSFGVSSDNTLFSVDKDGVLYYHSATLKGTIAIMAPRGSSTWTETNPLVLSSTVAYVNLSFLNGMENIPAVSVPATCTNITTIAKLVSLKTLILTKTTTEITKIAKDSLALLNADINIKVPSSLVDDYKADAVWGTRANYITAID